MTPTELTCWCGGKTFRRFSADYSECERCGTLVGHSGLSQHEIAVGPDESGFYGKEYWLSGMCEEGKNFPDIFARARGELIERNLYWCKTTLSLKPSGAKVLELGCSHGGFLGILSEAGYDVTGIELSPWVCDFARKTFDVEVLCGPVESHELAAGSYDLIALMDVLEHLPDPGATMRECVRLLKPDGIMLIQTPRHIRGRTYRALEEAEHGFLKMLLPKEHIYLFTEESVATFCRGIGLAHLAFLQPIFQEYDMYFAASRHAIAFRPEEIVRTDLAQSKPQRIVQGLLDLDDQRLALVKSLAESETDRIARLEIITNLTGQLAAVSRGLPSIPALLARLANGLARKGIDAKPEVLRKLVAEIENLRRSRELEVIEAQRLREEVNGAKKTHEMEIRRLTKQGEIAVKEAAETIERLRKESHDATEIAALRQALQESEADRAARLTQIHTLTRWLLEERAHRQGSVRAIGCVVVDLTPLLPGAENGGAKLMTLELLKRMAVQSPQTRFRLIVQTRSLVDVSGWGLANVEPVVIDLAAPAESWLIRLVSAMARPASERIRQGLVRRARRVMAKVARRGKEAGIVSELGGDVLFCPFTAPFYAHAGIPTVSVIYDLQYADYPQFFEDEDRAQRHQNFLQASLYADRLVCISEFVRRRVLEAANLPEARVKTVHIRMAKRLPGPSEEVVQSVLRRFALRRDRYLVYPANFWKHKNHEMLLVAFGIFRSRNAPSDLMLVCTGAPGPRQEFLKQSAQRMGLGDRIMFPGFLADEEYAALMHQCLAVIYPSLYEGFGMPVIEAQALGKPVACSNATSLPEVAGEAALLFDPKLPMSIAEAIERIDSDAALRDDLRVKGFKNAEAFQDADLMAEEYLSIFREVLSQASQAITK